MTEGAYSILALISVLQLLILHHRTAHQKKRKGIDWCGQNTQKWLTGDTYEDELLPPEPKSIKTGPTPEKLFDDNKPYTILPAIGDIVAVPFVDRSADNSEDEHHKKTFWLGKVMRLEESTALLGWLQETENGNYKLKIGASWEEASIVLLCMLCYNL